MNIFRQRYSYLKSTLQRRYSSKLTRRSNTSSDSGYLGQIEHYEPEEGCVFCKKCKSLPKAYWLTHVLRSNGVVVCPKLRAMKCYKCNGTGDDAHTIGYCPLASSTERYEARARHRKIVKDVSRQGSQTMSRKNRRQMGRVALRKRSTPYPRAQQAETLDLDVRSK